jgi:hypothetical protein
MTWPPRKYRRFEISHPFSRFREDDVASQEVQKVRDIIQFILRAGRSCSLLGSTEGAIYHILFIAYWKMTWPPRKYRRFQISHHFFCVDEDAAASHEV